MIHQRQRSPIEGRAIGRWPSSNSRPMKADIRNRSHYQCHVAADLEDRLRAWRLVYRVYRDKGFADDRASGLWYNPHDLLEETTTFVVDCDGSAVATCTVVFDSELALPADELYHDELQSLRAAGRRLCEFISHVNTVGGRTGASILMENHRNAFLTARCLEGATDFVIAVNPRHQAYFERTLLFECIGPERDFGKVQGAPAVLMRLDFETMAERYAAAFADGPPERDLYRFFFAPEGFDKLAWIASNRKPLEQDSLQSWLVAHEYA